MGEGRAAWTRHEVAVGGDVLHVESAGSGDDAVVLCHGLGGTHAVWYQQVAHFAARYRVVTWDARGFGASTDTGGQAGVVRSATDLAAVLDALGIARAHVVGQSMGGWTALGFALANPTRVRSLVLTNSLAGIAPDAWLAGLRGAPAPVNDAFVGEHAALGPTLRRDDPAKAFLYQQLGSTRPAPPEAMRSLVTTGFDDAALAWLVSPVLMIGSTEDDIFPVPLLEDAVSRLPVARLHVVSGAGHSTYFEQPAAWNAVVGSFLTDVERQEVA